MRLFSYFLGITFFVSLTGTAFQWPDTRLGPLEPNDRRFPLPGLVGSPRSQHRQTNRAVTRYPRVPRYDADVLVAELPHERQSSTFEQFMTVTKQVNVCY